MIFGILCFLMIRSFKLQQSSSYLRNHAGILALLLSISYGILIEILQATVFIHRSGDVRDAIANSIGAFIGLWSFTKIAKRINFEK